MTNAGRTLRDARCMSRVSLVQLANGSGIHVTRLSNIEPLTKADLEHVPRWLINADLCEQIRKAIEADEGGSEYFAPCSRQVAKEVRELTTEKQP